MPGIAGLITKMPRAWAERQLQEMLATMRHEPFYTCGMWCDEKAGVYAGWVARRGGLDEKMPLKDVTGSALLIFSGEDFSEAHAESIPRNGHVAASPATQHLLDRFESDPAFPSSLNGRFHGIAVDRTNGTILLFNDRYGMHRLYYYESNEAFYFAAEAKAILRVRPEARTMDPRGLGEYIVCGCVLENRSLFQGVHALRPGSAWRFRNGNLEERKSYFSPRQWEERPKLDAEDYYLELRETFSRILPVYFDGPEKIGISLTGGLDSRMIMAWQRAAPGSTPCYSFGGSYRDCQDVIIARRVAKACKQTHQVIPVGGEFLSKFPRYAERTVYLTDGCVGVSHSPDLFVNERARQIAPVRMTGNYGSEVLRRSRAFKPSAPLEGLYSSDLRGSFEQASETYNDAYHRHPLSFAVFHQAPWHHYGLLALEQTQLALRSPFLDNRLVKLVFQAPDSACCDSRMSLRLVEDGNPALGRIHTDRGLAVNRNRFVTACDHALQEFTYKAEYAYDYGMPQWIAKIDHAFAPLHLERLFLGRQKFYHFRVWYRDQLARHVREMLLDPRSFNRSYLDKYALEAVVNGHLKGNQNFTSEIHTLLTLEYVQRLFIDSSCTSTS